MVLNQELGHPAQAIGHRDFHTEGEGADSTTHEQMLPWRSEVLSPGPQSQHAKKRKNKSVLGMGSAHKEREAVELSHPAASPSLGWAFLKKMPNSLQKQRAQSTTTNPSPEQFHGMLLWDLWKARRAVLNASFPWPFSQKGAQSWWLIVWCAENMFLNPFHKRCLGACRDKPPCFPRAGHILGEGEFPGLWASQTQWGLWVLHTHWVPCPGFSAFWVYLPKSCAFPAFRRGSQTSTALIHCSFYVH